MNTILRFGAALLISSATISASAQPPGVGPAEVLPGYCLFSVVINTTSTDPGYTTLVTVVDVDDNQMVLTHSNKGNANLNCSGKLDSSAPIVGIDAFVNPGLPVEGIPLPLDEACAVLESQGAEICSGYAGALMLDYENTGGVTCNLPVEGGYRVSTDWRQLTTPSGRLKLYCHWNSNKDTFVPVP